MNILVIGDVIGQPGIRALVSMLPGLKKHYNPDFTIVNGENSADGFGITESLVHTILGAGADMITTGNHVWQQREIFPYLDSTDLVLRPANYPPGAPGKGFGIYEKKGVRFGVINLQGRTRMWPIDCPLRKAREILRKIESQTDIVLVDMHAESPEEKEALAWDLDGKVQGVFGTHTHIQTMDERILPKGTAFLTDLGATGPRNSIIGFDPETGIRRNLTQLPLKSEVSSNPAILCGIVLTLDRDTKAVTHIKRIREQSAV
ncbi:MAG: TIGR00282 family metallophosphoesterase [Spirochaetales bacterium]|nr:TIGR00282 family metallophosphoesterase [Spirochaetales bacterium]